MRAFATLHVRPPLWAVLLGTTLLALSGARVEAQVNPLWDHYKVYFNTCQNCVFANTPVTLRDQFGTFDHTVMQVQLFANPVQKAIPGDGVYPINDPVTHYPWWRITPQPFEAQVIVSNQFGDQTLRVHEAVYLLPPALKNQFGQPPNRNHYKCYACDGPAVNRPVVLTDQFDQWSTTVMMPRFYCNPVEKLHGPVLYPILDPNQHYVCYEFQPADPGSFSAHWEDQFGHSPIFGLQPGQFLCVPTIKQEVVPVETETWGRTKARYR